MKLSVIIPAFNESKNFERGVLDEVLVYLKKQPYTWEILLVNDGSTDNTLSLLKSFAKKDSQIKVVDIKHGGKVAAVAAGVEEAVGEYLLFTDFDQSTPITTVKKVLEVFNTGADVVIGNRAADESNVKLPGFIKFRSLVFNLLVQGILLPGISDSQCGFKAFKTEVAKKLFHGLIVTHKTQTGGYKGAFDAELLFLARKYNYKVKTIPVKWDYVESTRLDPWEPVKMLRDIILVRIYDLFGRYINQSYKTSWKNHLPIVCLLLLLTIPAVMNITKPGFFPMHDDLQIGRQYIMDHCFKDGQFPCRWNEEFGYGFGYPMFNFYPPFPYYLGHVFRIVGMQYIDIVKVVAVLNFAVSAIGMYLLAQEFFGKKGGFIAGLFYVYAPYHATDIYVRAAMNEAWAMAWFPFIYWCIYKTIKENRWRYAVGLGLSTGLLLLSHNAMSMIFAPTAIVWTLFWLGALKNWRSLVKLVFSGILALGLAAFFLLPVLVEGHFTHIDNIVNGYFNYLAHFADLNQLFVSRTWGYGASYEGPNDGMSFQIGHIHWIVMLVSLLVGLVYFKTWKDRILYGSIIGTGIIGLAFIVSLNPYLDRTQALAIPIWIYLGIIGAFSAMISAAIVLWKRTPNKIPFMLFLLFFITLFYVYMMHQKSSFIWRNIKSLEYLQFPWRFLSYTIFGASFLAGSLAVLLNKLKPSSWRWGILLLGSLGVILFYQGYFNWRDYYPHWTDQDKLTGKEWQLQLTGSIFDYLPIWAPLPPPDPANGNAEIIEGEGDFKTLDKNSIKQEYSVSVSKPAILQINTFYFPGWKYFVNGQEITVDPTRDKLLGRPQIDLQPGDYQVVALFTDTLIRSVGNYISLASWLLLLGIIVWSLKTKVR